MFEDWKIIRYSITYEFVADRGVSGDRIVVVVQKQRSFGPESGPGGSVSIAAANKVRRGDIRHAVVVRTAKKLQRPDGSVVRFDDNACVLINKGGEPIGSRLNGIVGQELRDKKWSKVSGISQFDRTYSNKATLS